MTTLTRPQATDYLDGAGVELDLVLGEYADLIEATESGLATHDHNGGDGGQIAYSNLSGLPTLGTAAALDVGTTANKILQLDATAKLPAVDGSQLTNLPSVVGDHGALSGLADDDHAQYHTDARGDARYSVLAHNHAGVYEASGATATHSALTSAVHGITVFGASLVDDASAADARSTLGLGGASTLSVGTIAGTVAAGDDARLTDARTPVAHNHVTGDVTGFAAGALAAAPAETASSVGSLIAGATDKATPVDADNIAISDSAAANILKRLSWANVKTALASVFARLAGTAGGQTLIGGTAAGEKLTLQSTAHATKGAIIFGSASEYDHVNDRLGIGTLTPTAKMHALATTEQLRLGYDTSNYLATTVSSAGVSTLASTAGQYVFSAPTESIATVGSELLSNSSFASDLSSWTDSGATWSWSAGSALHTAGSASTLSQDVAVVSGSTYQVDFNMSGRTAGYVTVTLGAVSLVESGSSTGFTGTATRTLVAGATGTVTLSIVPHSTFDGKIDSISLRQINLGTASVPISVLHGSVGMELRSSATLFNLSAGVSAGRSLRSGYGNSNFGFSAGYAETSGYYNSNFGYQAGLAITTGFGNSNYGYASGSAITSGINNTTFGNNSGKSITTGNGNSIFGNNAGRYIADGSTALTTPGNCVYIGSSTKASADGVTAENVFGYNATGIGSNTTCIGASSNTKTQIYGDIILDKTVTAAGTTGAQTINKTCGSVNFRAGDTSLVVTDNRVTTASVIVATVATNDATMKTVLVVAAAGSFTITANAAATAETRVNFIVIN